MVSPNSKSKFAAQPLDGSSWAIQEYFRLPCTVLVSIIIMDENNYIKLTTFHNS